MVELWMGEGDIYYIESVLQSLMTRTLLRPEKLQGPVVQSILSLTSSFRGSNQVLYNFISKYTDIFC